MNVLLRKLWYQIRWSPLQKIWSWLKWGDPLRYSADLRTLLEFFDDVMRAHGLTYWLDYGVLLGCVRHGRLILWDYDLDFGVTTQSFADFRDVMAHMALPPGFSYRYKPDERYAQLQLNDVVADVVEYAYEPDARRYKPNLIPYYDDAVNWAEYCPPMPEDVVMPLGTGRMWDRAYPIPHKPDAYLKIVYGNYAKVDRIPLLFSYLYHPRRTAAFMATATRAR